MDCAVRSLQAKVCVGHAHADSRPDSRAEKGSCKHPYLSTHLKMLRATGPQSQSSHAHMHFCKAGAGSCQQRSCAARMMQPSIDQRNALCFRTLASCWHHRIPLCAGRVKR